MTNEDAKGTPVSKKQKEAKQGEKNKGSPHTFWFVIRRSLRMRIHDCTVQAVAE
jgi:hypothetical protein